MEMIVSFHLEKGGKYQDYRVLCSLESAISDALIFSCTQVRSAPYSHCICRHLAASEGCFQLSEWLLSKGAHINACDRFQRTPLQVSTTV